MRIHYSWVNLPELLILLLQVPLVYLAAYSIALAYFATQSNLTAISNGPKDSSINLSTDDILVLFESVPKLDLHQLLNATTFIDLEKEYKYYYHHLKYISNTNMTHLIKLGQLIKHLLYIKPLLYLSCLLGKSKHKP